MPDDNKKVVVIGAGPAGLMAAYDLVQAGITPLVLEKSDKVGGISRTETFRDYRFDIGGHRFFTKNRRIDALWRELMGDDFLKVGRLSRIFYRGRYFNYPFQFGNAFSNLGLIESIRTGCSYIRSRLFPYREEETFEQWVSNRFGRRLFHMFFESYTEKVWGMRCSEIRAEWAAQRIKGLSLVVAVTNALFGTRKAKSLIDEFDYPVEGPGLMWDRFRAAIEAKGGRVLVEAEAVGVDCRDGRAVAVRYRHDGSEHTEPVDHLLSSAPITELVDIVTPGAPDAVRHARAQLKHRAFLIVLLIVDRPDTFPDQWVYIHEPGVRVGRVQNFKNWSLAMVPDASRTSLGMEYFCDEGDELWSTPDADLAALAAREIEALGLARGADVVESFVMRQPGAYPVYDHGYEEHLRTVRDHIDGIPNLQTIGRNGMHRYNNMDHSMQTGHLAARNVLGESHDVWMVNEDAEYHEETAASEEELAAMRRAACDSFARLDPLAFASASGVVLGLGLFLATNWVVIRGGDVVAAKMALLAQYMAGYTVTLPGSFIGLVYGFVWAAMAGWLFAYLRNLMLTLHVYEIKRKAELKSFRDFMDHL